jgi:hypothetical protein
MNKEPAEIRFWRYVDKSNKAKSGKPDCWVWFGGANDRGYGTFWSGETFMRAHRWSYFYHNPNGDRSLLVLHKCDNPRCVNPDHLFLGTNADNAADMIAKGRQLVGERSTGAKLTAAQALEIKRRSKPGDCVKLAREFGVWPQTILNIRHGKNWKCLDHPTAARAA